MSRILEILRNFVEKSRRRDVLPPQQFAARIICGSCSETKDDGSPVTVTAKMLLSIA